MSRGEETNLLCRGIPNESRAGPPVRGRGGGGLITAFQEDTVEQEVGGSEDELYSGDTWHTPPEPGDQGQRQP